MQVAVAHEDYYERGGGEYVAEQLARIFDAPIYTGFISSDVSPPEDIDVHGLFGDGISGSVIKRSRLIRDAYNQFAWQRVEELYDYDIIIQSGNNPGWFVPKDEQIVVKYVHSTPRTAYDMFWDRGDNPLTFAYSYATRLFYQQTLPYPDIYIANSDLVARRIRKYWGISDDKIRVVYPPTETSEYSPRPTKDYYLTYSRLAENKRIDEIIRAFNDTEKKLVIGGKGEQREKLEQLSSENVEFVGYMDEEEKKRRLGEARAVIFNGENEDFGMVPIESLSSGTPVIAVSEGFTKYQVEDGVNGILHDGSCEDIKNAITRFENIDLEWDQEDIQEFAEQFSYQSFEQGIQDAVDEAINNSKISPELFE